MDLLTISEIAKRLKQPESTVRYWRNKFDDFIPSVGSGRKKRYRPEAIRVFTLIADLSAEELPSEDIAERLSADFPRSIDNSNDNSSNTATMTLYTPTSALQRLIEGQDLLIRAQAEQTARQTEMDDMKREIQELRQRIEDMNRAALPWYKRIRRKTNQSEKNDAPDGD